MGVPLRVPVCAPPLPPLAGSPLSCATQEQNCRPPAPLHEAPIPYLQWNLPLERLTVTYPLKSALTLPPETTFTQVFLEHPLQTGISLSTPHLII